MVCWRGSKVASSTDCHLWLPLSPFDVLASHRGCELSASPRQSQRASPAFLAARTQFLDRYGANGGTHFANALSSPLPPPPTVAKGRATKPRAPERIFNGHFS